MNKKILTISGSSRSDSSNVKLLKALALLDSRNEYILYDGLSDIPLFAAEKDCHPWSQKVLEWRSAIKNADAVIVCTPEYIHNIPAQIKSALEWVTSSGELKDKRTLAITYTPHAPRGERAMQSLLWSLEALDASVVAQVPLHQDQIKVVDGKIEGDKEILEMLTEVLGML